MPGIYATVPDFAVFRGTRGEVARATHVRAEYQPLGAAPTRGGPMNARILPFSLAVLLGAGALTAAEDTQRPPAEPPVDAREVHLAGLLQLTRAGENAEAYWSPDGTQLILQSTHPPYA